MTLRRVLVTDEGLAEARRLIQEWHAATSHFSVTPRIIAHPTAAAVRALGDAALVALLAGMGEDFGNVMLLEAMTAAAPYDSTMPPPLSRTYVCECWRRWGQRHGYLSGDLPSDRLTPEEHACVETIDVAYRRPPHDPWWEEVDPNTLRPSVEDFMCLRAMIERLRWGGNGGCSG